MSSLLIFVRFHDGRYHGRPEWPPSPARLFQALVAGVAHVEGLTDEDRRALTWLESLEAPVIATPQMQAGQSVKKFVPNNDLDSVGYDPARIGEIRTPKLFRPILFHAESPLTYVWSFDAKPEALEQAQRVRVIAERLYQLGRGVDMAWAWGEIVNGPDPDALLALHADVIHRPTDGAGGTALSVPLKGSLASLVERHQKVRTRFRTLYESKPTKKEPDRKVAIGQILVQPPKPRFARVSYNSPTARKLFDLTGDMSWRLDRIVALTEYARDAAAQRLESKQLEEAAKIQRVIVGRRNGDEGDKATRVRITPLPSIGHRYADHAIRCILVEIPPNCPLRKDDVEWAFSGLELTDVSIEHKTGEVQDRFALAAATDHRMLSHYGIDDAEPALLWRTVTPAALPVQIARVHSARRYPKAKGSFERADEYAKVTSAVVHTLRHAGVSARPRHVRVQREPFDAKGARAEAFAHGSRFGKERLWHVELSFEQAMPGPLILGDGRYLGLGLMAPVRHVWRDVVAFSLPADVRVAVSERTDFLRAVRRALMALSRDDKGKVPPLFSGHEPDGTPAGSGRHRHAFLACADLDRDGYIERLMVAAPWACDRLARPSRGDRREFDHVAASLNLVRAGRLGVIPLRTSCPDGRLTGPSLTWESHGDYRPCRHAGRGKDPAASLLRDVAAECERRGLPKPGVELLDLSVGPNNGVAARLRLRFAVAVPGPILLGRDSHYGGGLFEAIVR